MEEIQECYESKQYCCVTFFFCSLNVKYYLQTCSVQKIVLCSIERTSSSSALFSDEILCVRWFCEKSEAKQVATTLQRERQWDGKLKHAFDVQQALEGHGTGSAAPQNLTFRAHLNKGVARETCNIATWYHHCNCWRLHALQHIPICHVWLRRQFYKYAECCFPCCWVFRWMMWQWCFHSLSVVWSSPGKRLWNKLCREFKMYSSGFLELGHETKSWWVPLLY